MQFQTIFFTCIIALTTFTSASPLQKRAVKVTSDTGSEDITPAISTSTSDLQDVGGKADAAGAVADVVNKVVQLVQGLVDKDIARRQRFTKETVSAVIGQFPGRTVVMSNVGYTLSCTPEVLSKTSYKAKVGSNVSFDVLVFGSGCTFTLNGDGGFENWAYILKSGCTANGKTLTC